MKKLLFVLIFGTFILNGCQQEDPVPANQDVRFALSIANSETADEASPDHFPDEVAARLTLTSSAGDVILRDGIVRFKKAGTVYISDQLTLKSGSYAIRDFELQYEAVETFSGSGSNFVVSHNGPGVVPLGTATLRKGVHPMHISVYVGPDGQQTLTDATVYISNQEGEYYEYDLAPRKNTIAFRGDPQKSYSIEIRKAGYDPYISTFVYDQLDKKRLEVTLREQVIDPSPSVTFQPSATYFSMWLQFTGKGSVTLDWGNGNTELIDFDVDPENATGTAFRFRDQAYALSIPPAKITGDIHLLVGLYFEADVDALNSEYATALTELSFTEVDMPELNLATNSQLTTLTFNNATFGELILPQQHAIRHLWIAPSPFWPNTQQLDYIISNVYVNTVAGNFLNGDITLNGAPVSQESATMLQDLHENYGWQISY